MKKHFTLIILFICLSYWAQSQINPTDSPYNDPGSFTVVSDSDMTALSCPLLFYHPQESGKYPVFMFQLGANGFGSSVINRHTYDLFMKHLASYGFTVIIIDDSQAGFPNGTTFKAAHTWYKDKCNDNNHWLSEFADTDKFIVGGHSNGGVNASAILVDRPNEINGIVFFDSYPSPGTFGIGAHDVSNYSGKVLSMAADENTPDTYKGGFNLFAKANCKTFINVTGLDHGGFGDYILESQPVGPIGRDNATGTIRHYFISWFLSEFKNDNNASLQLITSSLQPNTTKEFINNCGTVGFAEPNNHNLTIFPNPTTGMLKIENCPTPQTLSIFNVHGERVYFSQNIKADSSIDVENLPQGMYWIQLQNISSGNIISGSFIKN